MGNPKRSKDSASLLTREPVPDAISLADATYMVDKGLVWEASVQVWSMTCTMGSGAPQRDMVMAVVATAFPIQESREEVERDGSSGWCAWLKIEVVVVGVIVDWVLVPVFAREDGTNADTGTCRVPHWRTRNAARQPVSVVVVVVRRVFMAGKEMGQDLVSNVNYALL